MKAVPNLFGFIGALFFFLVLSLPSLSLSDESIKNGPLKVELFRKPAGIVISANNGNEIFKLSGNSQHGPFTYTDRNGRKIYPAHIYGVLVKDKKMDVLFSESKGGSAFLKVVCEFKSPKTVRITAPNIN